MRRVRAPLCVLLTFALLCGCQSYRLQGLVVSGDTPGIALVNKDDSRLKQPGVPGAVVETTLDPQRLNAKPMGAGVSDDKGWFSIEVREPGAGLLDLDIGVLARMNGFSDVWQEMRLPSSDRRLLVIMTPGHDTVRRRQDVFKDSLRLDDPFNK